MLFADYAGVVLTSPRGLTRMMNIIVVACREFGLTVSENKAEANERSLGGMGLTRETWCCAGRLLSRLDMDICQTSIKPVYYYERSELLIDDDGEKNTQRNVHRHNCRCRPRRCNYWSITSLKTTVRTVLPIYSGARDPSGER